jgi:hypothetical protein
MDLEEIRKFPKEEDTVHLVKCSWALVWMKTGNGYTDVVAKGMWSVNEMVYM